MAKKQAGEERVYLAHTSALLFITVEVRTRTQNRAGTRRQELMQRPWKRAAYWLVSHVHLLIKLKTTSPGTAPPTDH